MKQSIIINGKKVILQTEMIPTQTGDQEVYRGNFNAKFVSVSDTVLENSRGTEYRIATIEFKNSVGEIKTVTGIMWEKNYVKGMDAGTLTEGTSLLCNVTFTPGRDEPGITVSHLTGSGSRASFADLGFSWEGIEVEEPVTQKELDKSF